MMFEKFWYRASLWACFFYPVSLIFRFFSGLRRMAYRSNLLQPTHCPVPVIVVGNITTGGTGKSPLVIYLVELLRAHGFNPGVVSRGYGGSLNRVPTGVYPESLPEEVGDEPVMIVRRTKVPMVIGRKRVLAAKACYQQFGVDVIISDDGLQHYALARDIEIAVIDGERRFGNGWLLPAGPLREPLSRLQKVDAIVTNGTPKPGEFKMELVADHMQRVCKPEVRQPLNYFGERLVYAVAGIGNPERFFNLLTEFGMQIIPCPYPDHYSYKSTDLDFATSAPIVMTEKDAVKCKDFDDDKLWSLTVSAKLDPAFDDIILTALHKVIVNRP